MRLFLVLAIWLGALGAVADTRVALIIGNSAYTSVGALANPSNDARLIGQTLRDHDFDVTTALDLSRRAMLRALQDFRDKADRADVAMVYFAGHGIEVDGENFLIPVDAELRDQRDIEVETISVDTVLAQISGAKRMRMIVLDACRDNPFAARMVRTGRGRNIGRGLSRVVSAPQATLIAYAAAAGETTPDGDPGGNSPFSAAFASAFGEEPMDIRRMMGVVGDKMRQVDRGAQPFVYNSLGGQAFILNDGLGRRDPELPDTDKKFERNASHSDWSVFRNEDAGLQCWAASKPIASTATRNGQPVQIRRGDVFLLIATRPDDGVKHEISYVLGYPAQKNSRVKGEVRSGGGSFEFQLFTEGENAWTSSAEEDARLADEFRRSDSVVLNAVSSRGTATEDRFSLQGVAQALNEVERLCAR